jgi:hypothetical protein
MKKHHEATLVAICDALADGMSYSAAARCNGVSKRSLFMWLQASRNNDPAFLIHYLDSEEPQQFVKCANVARRIHYLEMRSEFERRCLHGHEEIVTFQGKVQYREDPRCVGLDEDTRELLGYERDGLLRNERGEVIPLTIRHPPPVAAVLRALAVGFPDEWRETTNTNSNLNISGGAVIGVAHMKPSTSDQRPLPPLPPRPKVPELEVLNAGDHLELPEIADAPEPVAPEPEPEPEPAAPEAEPEPVVVVTAPTRAERSGRPLSALEADLLKRARGTPEQRSAPVGAK